MYRNRLSFEKLDARALMAADLAIESWSMPVADPSIGLLQPAEEYAQKVYADPGAGPHVFEDDDGLLLPAVKTVEDDVFQKVRSWSWVDPNNPNQDSDPLAFHWDMEA